MAARWVRIIHQTVVQAAMFNASVRVRRLSGDVTAVVYKVQRMHLGTLLKFPRGSAREIALERAVF